MSTLKITLLTTNLNIQTYEKKTIFCCTSAAIAPKNIACYEINADFVFGISIASRLILIVNKSY